MAFPDQSLPQLRNRLLASLPPEDLAKLWPQLEPVELEFRKSLYLPEQPTSVVYFIEAGYVSRLAPMEDGDGAEVGLVGPEGMVGLAALLGSDRDNFEMLVQVPGTALRMDITDRPGLEAASCGCYGTVRRSDDRLLEQPGSAKAPYWG